MTEINEGERQISHAEEFQIIHVDTLLPKATGHKPYSLVCKQQSDFLPDGSMDGGVGKKFIVQNLTNTISDK